jgi:CotH kinase protein/Chitobiase/beta-hexosaminidase C-terminal domain
VNSTPQVPNRPSPAPPGRVPPKLPPKPPPRKSGGGGWFLILLLFFSVLLLFVLPHLAPFQRPARPVWNPAPPPANGWRQNQFPPAPRQPTSGRFGLKKASETVAGPRAAPPSFSPAAGIYRDAVTVELRGKTNSARIRYTLDGSEPTAASREYTEPIAISGTTLLQAKCFEPGVAPSATVSHTYTILDSNLADFTSNLPLVVINTFGQPITKQQPILASLRVIDPGGRRSSLTATGGFTGQCEIKVRGYTSLRFPKHSFTVKTRDDSGQALHTSILGMPKGSDWVLYAPYSDKTLMRDVLAYELSNKMGRWAARTRFVEVFVNRYGGNLSKRDYVGVYVFEEKIKRGKARVNIQKLTPEDNTEPNITGGYIFKRDHTTQPGDMPFGLFGQRPMSPSRDGYGFVTSRGMPLFYVEPKEREITPAQKAYLSRYLNQLERALYGPNFRSPTEGYAKYLDVDSFIDQFWIVELSKNIDGFRYSCFMFKDRGGKVRLEPIWDWNLSFGNANYNQGWMPEYWYWHLLRENEVSWYRRLSQDPDFMQRLIDRWAELRRGVFDPDSILKRVDELAQQLREAQARNYRRWPILGQDVHPNWYIGDSYEDEVNWMKKWIRERVAWIDTQFVTPPTLSRTDQAESAGQKLTLEARAGQVYYTLDGSDPRLAGGDVSPDAQEYSGPIALGPSQRLFARARLGAKWSGPTLGKAAATDSARK